MYNIVEIVMSMMQKKYTLLHKQENLHRLVLYLIGPTCEQQTLLKDVLENIDILHVPCVIRIYTFAYHQNKGLFVLKDNDQLMFTCNFVSNCNQM